MTTLHANLRQAVSLHRQAAAAVRSAELALASHLAAAGISEQRDLAEQLRAYAADLAPGWLSTRFDPRVEPAHLPTGSATPTFVRIGEAHPLGDARFPVVVPLLGAGHLAFDADARDPRVAAVLRSVVLRVLAAPLPGLVEMRAVDAAGSGDTLAPFHGVVRTESDHDGLCAVLAEAEEWVGSHSRRVPEQMMVIVIASLPELTEVEDLARIAALAGAGAAAGLHLIAAGWPPPPLTAETTQAPLRDCTQVTLRNPYVWVGDPPGGTFAGDGRGPGRLNAPVFLDPDPPAELIAQVVEGLTTRAAAVPATQPTRDGWPAYLCAAQRLDAVRRTAAAAVAEQAAVPPATRNGVEMVRARLALQRVRLEDAAPPPDTAPGEDTVPIEMTQVVGALRLAAVALNDADALLDGAHPAGRTPRNTAVYVAFTLLGTLVQLALVLVVSTAPALALAALPVGLLVPVGSFALGWLSLGAVFGLPRHRRTPGFGAVVSAVALLPLAALAGWLALGAPGDGSG